MLPTGRKSPNPTEINNKKHNHIGIKFVLIINKNIGLVNEK